MLITEQIRLYNEKMEEIEQLEYAETLAVNQLKLKRQNTVRKCSALYLLHNNSLIYFQLLRVKTPPCKDGVYLSPSGQFAMLIYQAIWVT